MNFRESYARVTYNYVISRDEQGRMHRCHLEIKYPIMHRCHLEIKYPIIRLSKRVLWKSQEEGDYVWIKQFVGNQKWILGKVMQELPTTM